ncbi:MAG TPA: GNAT family N-acetyltransferase [Chloroflexota bacterium]|nr:GNAT family N-acetyltransferase [Chloroflexota bacterium]
MHIDTPIVLEGRFVRLEPLRLAHAEELFAIGHDEEIWRYLPTATPATLEAMRQWIADTLRQEQAGTAVPFAIIDRALGRAIGSTRYHEIAAEHYGLEIGWTWLGRAYWRTAFNTECKYLLLRHAFERLGAIRLEIRTDVRNVRSQAAIERLGAVREGVLRNHRIVKDGYRRSSVYYSIIDEEWPAVKARLEGWLAPRAGA